MIRSTELAVRYAQLRGDERWLDSIAVVGLEVEPDGTIELQRVPAVVPASITAAGPASASGMAIDDACGLYLADARDHVVFRVALDCGDRLQWPGRGDPFATPSPAGLCIGPMGYLYLALPAQGQVLVLTSPDMNAINALSQGLQQPTWVAADGAVALLVSDPGSGLVARFDALGAIDTAFQGAFALPAGSAGPGCLVIDADGVMYLACDGVAGLNRYGRDGRPAGPALATDTEPAAVAIAGSVLYVADRATGEVRLFRLPDGGFIGSVCGFRGPVSAIGVGPDSTLYLKTGDDDAYVVGKPDAGRVPNGTITAGPLDAGVDNSWYRLAVAAVEPASTQARLDTFSSSTAAAVPAWAAAPSLDELLSDRPQRYLWARITLSSVDGVSTPQVLQVEAETPGDSYLNYLPAVYAREASGDFLERLLDLAKSVLGDLEAAIADLPRIYDPETSPANDLPWLASWLAFDLPDSLADLKHPDRVRSLISRLHSLYKRRGTPAGVSEFVEIYTGTRPTLIEDFRARGVWVLGATSVLGFDTCLPTTSVDGLIVDESVVGAITLAEDGWGWSLFEPTAHRFTVVVPAASVTDEAARRRLRGVIADQKPAHTDFHLCFAEASLRVGMQSRLGIDAIIAGPPHPSPLGAGDALDRDLYLTDDPPAAPGAVQRRARIGIDTRLA
jgi:phage tail-like protein